MSTSYTVIPPKNSKFGSYVYPIQDDLTMDNTILTTKKTITTARTMIVNDYDASEPAPDFDKLLKRNKHQSTRDQKTQVANSQTCSIVTTDLPNNTMPTSSIDRVDNSCLDPESRVTIGKFEQSPAKMSNIISEVVPLSTKFYKPPEPCLFMSSKDENMIWKKYEMQHVKVEKNERVREKMKKTLLNLGFVKLNDDNVKTWTKCRGNLPRIAYFPPLVDGVVPICKSCLERIQSHKRKKHGDSYDFSKWHLKKEIPTSGCMYCCLGEDPLEVRLMGYTKYLPSDEYRAAGDLQKLHVRSSNSRTYLDYFPLDHRQHQQYHDNSSIRHPRYHLDQNVFDTISPVKRFEEVPMDSDKTKIITHLLVPAQGAHKKPLVKRVDIFEMENESKNFEDNDKDVVNVNNLQFEGNHENSKGLHVRNKYRNSLETGHFDRTVFERCPGNNEVQPTRRDDNDNGWKVDHRDEGSNDCPSIFSKLSHDNRAYRRDHPQKGKYPGYRQHHYGSFQGEHFGHDSHQLFDKIPDQNHNQTYFQKEQTTQNHFHNVTYDDPHALTTRTILNSSTRDNLPHCGHDDPDTSGVSRHDPQNSRSTHCRKSCNFNGGECPHGYDHGHVHGRRYCADGKNNMYQNQMDWDGFESFPKKIAGL